MKQDQKIKLKSMAVLISLVLTACGGGGGSGSSAVPETPSAKMYPVESAITAYVMSSNTHTLTYTDPQGNIFTLEYSSVPGSDTSFNGQAAKTAIVTAAGKLNGQMTGTTSQTLYFQTAPFKLLGALNSDGAYSIAANQMTLPASAKVGDSGSFYTSTEYASASSNTVVSTSVGTWSLEADTADTAFFCQNESVTEAAANAQPFTSSECYRLNSAGAVTGMRVTLTVDGQSIVFAD